jgi:hypothetical protein
MPNRLIKEASPYLQQHAHNPVDWYPWGEEAFETARTKDLPVFLSIGYSTCHWCHVMAHESFENEEAARAMNRVFVSIKVDREERPDIDHTYMTVCQMMTGSGGWPLSIIMTPEKKPFFAGTYIPRENRMGRTGMLELSARVERMWNERREEVEEVTGKVVDALQSVESESTESTDAGKPDGALLERAFKELRKNYDPQWGGFGTAPKFPSAAGILFLLRCWSRTESTSPRDMALQTLTALRRGGIYDQVGFGFHRYSTDRHWLVPHFEKMLYDQALLALAYTEAYQVSGNQEMGGTVREVLAYVQRELRSPAGGFYSAQDAESEGVEGKYYLWTPDQIDQALTPDEAWFCRRVLDITQPGNYREEATGRSTGENIPNLLDFAEPATSLDAAADALGMEGGEFYKMLESVRAKLLAVRTERVPPATDDKVLTDWNGLMIGAFARAGWVFNEPSYIETAEQALEFLTAELAGPDGKLLHRFRMREGKGDAGIPGFLADYAALVWALIELHQATFDTRYLARALDLQAIQDREFRDWKDHGYFSVSHTAEQVLVRSKNLYDSPIPSGNSMTLYNLLRLAHLTGNEELHQSADLLTRRFAPETAGTPHAYTWFLSALDTGLGPAREIVIAGDAHAEDTRRMLGMLRSIYLPRGVIHLKTESSGPEIEKTAPFTIGQTSRGGRATAYVCENYTCRLPVTEPSELDKTLSS